MSTLPHPPTRSFDEHGWYAVLRLRDLWASVAISAMWIAVSVAAIWGPDLVSTSSDGNGTTIPSGVAVALFAMIGSWAVAKHAFGRRTD